MIAYVDTSVVLRVLLRQRGALRSWDKWTEIYASEILKLEARRVIDRRRLESALDDEGVALPIVVLTSESPPRCAVP